MPRQIKDVDRRQASEMTRATTQQKVDEPARKFATDGAGLAARGRERKHRSSSYSRTRESLERNGIGSGPSAGSNQTS
jgi:hypothetical protein